MFSFYVAVMVTDGLPLPLTSFSVNQRTASKVPNPPWLAENWLFTPQMEICLTGEVF